MNQDIPRAHLEQIILHSIMILETEKEELAQELSELQDLKVSVPKVVSEPIIVNIGGGYQAERTKIETLQFLDRRIQKLEVQRGKVEAKLVQAIEVKLKFDLLDGGIRDDSGINKEGSQIVDIQEDLDELGNIVDVRFRDSNGNDIEPIHEPQLPGQKDAMILNASDLNTSAGDQMADLLNDMELLPQSDNPHYDNKVERNEITPTRVDYSSGKNDSIENSYSTGSNNQELLYELELIASELEESADTPTGEDVDIDIESDEDSDNYFEIEVESDEDEFTENETLHSLLPKNAQLEERFWKEIQSLRIKRSEDLDTASNQGARIGKKSVRFSETLEIKEIEDVGKELRPTEFQRKILKFKENKILAGSSQGMNTAAVMQPVIHEVTDTDAVTTDIVEHEDNDSTSPVIVEVSEPCNDTTKEDQNFKELKARLQKEVLAEKRSKFKSMVAQNPLRRMMMTGPSTSIQLPQNKDGAFVEPDLTRNTVETTHVISGTLKSEVKQLNIDLPNLGDDLDAMVQAYNVGMFDDDIEVSGPVVDQLEDFELLNKIVENGSKVTPPMHQSKQEDAGNVEDSNFDSSDSDDEILKELIIENDLSSDEEANDSQLQDDVQMSVINQEVVDNYHRLRHKILNKLPRTDSEFEPVDGVQRTSRFKASRNNF
ncbi:CIC11C00000001156 [Sungouiella intermedia]|uniref:CIC11C00000001156 n=1 Tax=Sungouiella intermedia TaxID=45354 RepID=A0A1L0BLH3_9ASCO|nr:CIC11C00000001156 [[Candida] intermedia]